VTDKIAEKLERGKSLAHALAFERQDHPKNFVTMNDYRRDQYHLLRHVRVQLAILADLQAGEREGRVRLTQERREQ